MMNLQLNGEVREVPSGETLQQLLKRLELPVDRVAVEVNRRVIRQSEYAALILQANDEIEIVTFVGGG